MAENIYELEWVQKAWAEPLAESDVVFRPISVADEGDWHSNARIGKADGYAYGEGYRLGARILADYVIQGQWEADFLVYPIVFLYRHYIELQLKRLIPDGAFLASRSLTEDDRKLQMGSHRLDQLWGVLRPILVAVPDLVEGSDLNALDSYIRQVHAIDELSFSFRYPITKSGKPSIDHQKLPLINIGVMAACMERLTSYLFGLGEAFHEAVQTQCEMEAEARAEYDDYLGSFDASDDGY